MPSNMSNKVFSHNSQLLVVGIVAFYTDETVMLTSSLL